MRLKSTNFKQTDILGYDEISWSQMVKKNIKKKIGKNHNSLFLVSECCSKSVTTGVQSKFCTIQYLSTFRWYILSSLKESLTNEDFIISS